MRRVLAALLVMGGVAAAFPDALHAWTPGTHIYLGETILANLRLQQFGGIDSLTLTLEKVSYTDQQQPANSLQLNLDVNSETVTNLQTEEALKTWLNAFLLRIAIQQGMQSPGTMGKFLHFH